MSLSAYRLWFVLISIALLIGCSGEKTASEYLDSASIHLETGDIRAALIETRNAVSQAPESPEARLLLGRLELRVGNPTGAEAELVQAVELGIPETEVTELLAQSYLQTGKLGDLNAISIVGLADTDVAKVLGYQSIAALSQGKLTEAAKLADEGLEADPVSAIALTTNARLQLLEQNIPSARTYLITALDNTPTYSAAWELQGDIEALENRLPEAINAYSRALETASNRVSPLFKRARIHLALNDLASAGDDVQIIENSNVDAPVVSLLKAEILLRERKLAEAQITLENGLSKAPQDQLAVRTLAIVHMLRGNLEQAEQFAKQYAAATDSDDSRILLAAIRLQANRFQQAEQTLAPLTESGRLNILGAQVLATTLLKQNKLDDAINTMLRLHANIDRAGITETVPLAMLVDPVSLMSADLVSDKAISSENTGKESYLSERELLLVGAVSALAANDTTSALTIANQLRELMPEQPDVYTLVAHIHTAADNFSAASEALEIAIELDSEPETAIILASMLKMNAGDSETAISLLDEAYGSAQGPMRERLLLALAAIYAKIGQEENALKHLEQAKSNNPASYQPSLALANYYANSSMPEKVLKSLSELSTTSLQNPGIIELRVQAHIAIKQFSEAIDLVTPMVRSEPRATRWRYLRAKAFAGNNNFDAVNRDLDVALRIDPDHAPSALAKANLSILTNELLQAEMQLTQLQTLIPGSEALNQLSARLESAKLQDAQTLSPKVSGELSGSAQEVINRAKFLWSNGDQQTALNTLTGWVTENPGDILVLLTLANTYTALNRSDDAIAAYQSVLEVDANNFMALNNLAWQLRDRNPSAAMGHAKRSVQIQPDNAATLDTLAVIQLEQGMFTEAGITYEKIRALQPTNPTILFHGAQIEAALGNIDEARNILEPLINGNINFPEVIAAKALYIELQ